MWIVNDRLENRGNSSREYTQFMQVPALMSDEGAADRIRVLAESGGDLISVDPSARRIRLANPSFDSLEARFFSRADLKFGGGLNNAGEYDACSPVLEQWRKGARTARYTYSVRWQGAGNQSLVTLLVPRPAVTALKGTDAQDLKSVKQFESDGGVVGFQAVTSNGAEVWFQTGPEKSNVLATGPVTATAEAVLVVKKNGKFSGLALGCTKLVMNGNPQNLTCPDFEFAVPDLAGQVSFTHILKPIDTVQISPVQTVFTDTVDVSFAIPTQKTDDIEFRYTVDGSDPTLESPLYTKPFAVRETAMVKVRPFRKDLKATPWNIPGVLAGRVIAAIYRKQAPSPAVKTADMFQPGLRYEYFEGDWPRLFTYAGNEGVLKPKSSGVAASLLDGTELGGIRKTDRAYALRYSGYIDVPQTGVYSFYAPEHLYAATMDAGFDLRVFIDGNEWYPSPSVHSEDIWHIALAKGSHAFTVAYTDYRWKTFRDEFWCNWQEEQMWQGTPVLEVSGPGLKKQPLPKEWLRLSK